MGAMSEQPDGVPRDAEVEVRPAPAGPDDPPAEPEEPLNPA